MRPLVTGSLVGRRLFCATLVASVVCAAPPAAFADAAGAGGDVRPLQTRGRRLLESGAKRSATFRRLLGEIATSNVTVYVDLDPYEGLKLDGVLRFLGTGPGARYVAAWLRPRRTDDELIVTLAHELQHAVEVAGARYVASEVSFAQLYEGIGRSDNPGRFETEAAQRTAARVAAELRTHR